jgi:hypothetical protein
VLYLRLIILSVEDDISVDSEMFLVTNFVNLKIKSVQFSEVLIEIRCTCVHLQG